VGQQRGVQLPLSWSEGLGNLKLPSSFPSTHHSCTNSPSFSLLHAFSGAPVTNPHPPPAGRFSYLFSYHHDEHLHMDVYTPLCTHHRLHQSYPLPSFITNKTALPHFYHYYNQHTHTCAHTHTHTHHHHYHTLRYTSHTTHAQSPDTHITQRHTDHMIIPHTFHLSSPTHPQHTNRIITHLRTPFLLSSEDLSYHLD
jgi:hypothetical protein